MKKTILNLGKVLNKIEQKNINGHGSIPKGISDGNCKEDYKYCSYSNYTCELDQTCNYSHNRCECNDPAHGGLG